MAGQGERAPLLPPPLAAWLGGLLLRGLWTAGAVALIVAAVSLNGVAGAAGAAGGPPAPTVSSDPVAAIPSPAAVPMPLGSRPPGGLPPARAGRVFPRPRVDGRPPARQRPDPVRSLSPAPSRSGADPAPPTVPPAQGSYAYDVTFDGQVSQAAFTVTDHDNPGGHVVQDQTWSTSAGTRQSGVEWSADSEWLVRSESDGGSSCTYQPPVQWLQLPLHAGVQWEGQSSCSYTDDHGTLMRVQQSTAARVTSAASALLDGRRVFCWVVERDIVTAAATADATATSETRTTDLFAPALGLFVYETGKSAVPQPDGTVATDTWTAELYR